MKNETNYGHGPITEQDLSLWNDTAVMHEIKLTVEILLGNVKYNIPGLLTPNSAVPSPFYMSPFLYRDVVETWVLRFKNALREAKKRFYDDIDYMAELDAILFEIELEMV